MGKLPTALLRRPTCPLSTTLTTTTAPQQSTAHSALPPRALRSAAHAQQRHATFVLRPRRPYQFTQLVQLSDGSTFTVRTTSPAALVKSDKDSRNHILWQPSDKSLRNMEKDEAGKLAAFRGRFGRGWDIEAKPTAAEEGEAEMDAASKTKTKDAEAAKKKKMEEDKVAAAAAAPAPAETEEDPFDSLVDLISSYARDQPSLKGGVTATEAKKSDSKKK